MFAKASEVVDGFDIRGISPLCSVETRAAKRAIY